MTLERSAGLLLFHDAPGEPRRFLLLDYGKHWDYPKGHVEPGEDDVTAAHRELQEETGITRADILDGFSREMVYVFRGRRGNLIKKTVVFFVAKTDMTDVTISHEHVGFAWLTADDALARLTYPNARALLEAAVEFLADRPA